MVSDDGAGTSAVAPPEFGGTVATVLATPRITPAPPTLEEARNAPRALASGSRS